MSKEELWLTGDINTMATQKSVASSLDCKLDQRDVYPVVMGERDIRLALTAFFNRRTPGWDSYRDNMIRLNICTEDQFNKSRKVQLA